MKQHIADITSNQHLPESSDHALRAFECSLLAADAYHPGEISPLPQWELLGEGDVGGKVLFFDKASNLKSALYRRIGRDGTQLYVYSLAGTELLSVSDWLTSARQITAGGGAVRPRCEKRRSHHAPLQHTALLEAHIHRPLDGRRACRSMRHAHRLRRIHLQCHRIEPRHRPKARAEQAFAHTRPHSERRNCRLLPAHSRSARQRRQNNAATTRRDMAASGGFGYRKDSRMGTLRMLQPRRQAHAAVCSGLDNAQTQKAHRRLFQRQSVVASHGIKLHLMSTTVGILETSCKDV